MSASWASDEAYRQLLAELLERLTEARTIEDVNIAAGRALNGLACTDD